MKKITLRLTASDKDKISDKIVSTYVTVGNLLNDVIETPSWLLNLMDMEEKEFYEFFISDKLQQRVLLKEKGCGNIFDCLSELNEYFPKLKSSLNVDRNIERYIKDRVNKIRTILQKQRISP
jgi:hypothetical protein